MMQNYEIEIFCPEEYTEKKADAKYSDVIKTTYYSTTCEKERPVNIVLPARYSEEKEYPVLYVLHGIFGTQNDMNNNSIIIQNMMTEGIANDRENGFAIRYKLLKLLKLARGVISVIEFFFKLSLVSRR